MEKRTLIFYNIRHDNGFVEIIEAENGALYQLERCGLYWRRRWLPPSAVQEIDETSPFYFVGSEESTKPAALRWLAEQLEAGDSMRVHIISRPGHRNYFEAWAGVIVAITEDDMILVDLEVPGQALAGEPPAVVRRLFYPDEILL